MDLIKFNSLIDRSSDCHIWTAAKNNHNYGVAKVDGKFWYAHRLSYTINKGDIPEKMEIDHICYNTLCCNPEHLKLVTRQENIKNQRWKRKIYCKCGLKYDYVNQRGISICLKCKRKWDKKYKEIKRASARVAKSDSLQNCKVVGANPTLPSYEGLGYYPLDK